jgi:hypothetical protein
MSVPPPFCSRFSGWRYQGNQNNSIAEFGRRSGGDEESSYPRLQAAKAVTLKVLRFISLLLTALVTWVVICHPLERFGKITLSAPVYLNVEHVLYSGYAIFGAIAELGALVSIIHASGIAIRCRHAHHSGG